MEKNPRQPYDPYKKTNVRRAAKDVEISIESFKRKRNIEIPVHIFHLEQLVKKYIQFSAEYRRRKSTEEQINTDYELMCKQIELNAEAQRKQLYSERTRLIEKRSNKYDDELDQLDLNISRLSIQEGNQIRDLTIKCNADINSLDLVKLRLEVYELNCLIKALIININVELSIVKSSEDFFDSSGIHESFSQLNLQEIQNYIAQIDEIYKHPEYSPNAREFYEIMRNIKDPATRVLLTRHPNPYVPLSNFAHETRVRSAFTPGFTSDQLDTTLAPDRFGMFDSSTKPNAKTLKSKAKEITLEERGLKKEITKFEELKRQFNQNYVDLGSVNTPRFLGAQQQLKIIYEEEKKRLEQKPQSSNQQKATSFKYLFDSLQQINSGIEQINLENLEEEKAANNFINSELNTLASNESAILNESLKEASTLSEMGANTSNTAEAISQANEEIISILPPGLSDRFRQSIGTIFANIGSTLGSAASSIGSTLSSAASSMSRTTSRPVSVTTSMAPGGAPDLMVPSTSTRIPKKSIENRFANEYRADKKSMDKKTNVSVSNLMDTPSASSISSNTRAPSISSNTPSISSNAPSTSASSNTRAPSEPFYTRGSPFNIDFGPIENKFNASRANAANAANAQFDPFNGSNIFYPILRDEYNKFGPNGVETKYAELINTQLIPENQSALKNARDYILHGSLEDYEEYGGSKKKKSLKRKKSIKRKSKKRKKSIKRTRK